MPEWFPVEFVIEFIFVNFLYWGVAAILLGVLSGTVLLVSGLPRR